MRRQLLIGSHAIEVIYGYISMHARTICHRYNRYPSSGVAGAVHRIGTGEISTIRSMEDICFLHFLHLASSRAVSFLHVLPAEPVGMLFSHRTASHRRLVERRSLKRNPLGPSVWEGFARRGGCGG